MIIKVMIMIMTKVMIILIMTTQVFFFNVFPKKTRTLMLLRRHYFQVKTDIRETGIKEILDKMYNEEFAEVSFTGSKKKREMSQQDMRFMKILDAETKLKDGHYQIPLPF